MYKRKTKDVYEVHGNYGIGFEIVDNCETYKEAKESVKIYRESEVGIPFKIVIKRERIEVQS